MGTTDLPARSRDGCERSERARLGPKILDQKPVTALRPIRQNNDAVRAVEGGAFDCHANKKARSCREYSQLGWFNKLPKLLDEDLDNYLQSLTWC